MNKTILLIDMDAFFASVEQASNVQLKGKPIVVCGQGRTVAVAVSYEARKYGVKTGMTIQEAKRTCNCLIPVIGNMDKYIHASLEIQKIILNITPQVEVYSIDECYCDITNNIKPSITPFDIAKKIQNQIFKTLNITCSIGISNNKPLAKIASKLKKPNGICELYPQQFKEISNKFQLEKLSGVGIGRQTLRKLHKLNIYTVKDLSDVNFSLLKSYFGFYAFYLKKLSNGEGDDIVKEYVDRSIEKSISNSRTMPQDSNDIKIVRAYLRMICEMVSFRLRKKHLKTSNVYLGIRYGDFSYYGIQKQLKEHINDTKYIFDICLKLLNGIYPFKKPVRLIAVKLGNLIKDNGQMYMFEDMNRRDKVLKVVDEINSEYGDFVIKPASHLIAEKFGIRKNCGMVDREKIIK